MQDQVATRAKAKEQIFLNVYKIAQWSTQDYKKIFIFSKMVGIWT